MPTTRSQGRHEPLQRLETPLKRQRKQNPIKPLLNTHATQEPRTHVPNVSLPAQDTAACRNTNTVPITPVTHVHKCIQTEEVVVLTKIEIAELRDRASAAAPATAPSSHKRNHDNESDEDPLPKRHQFSTPQNNKVNNLWMFGEKANSDHPRTAPSKSLASSSIRRPLRGPIARRNNNVGSPRFRVRPSVMPGRDADLSRIKPIEREADNGHVDEYDRERPTEVSKLGTQQQRQQQESAIPHTPQRGLFGSLRGMVSKGWGLAASLTPLASRIEPEPTSQTPVTTDQVTYPRITADANNSDLFTDQSSAGAGQDVRHNSERVVRPDPSHLQRTSQYDHLHYVPADTDSVGKAIAGEIEPPARARTPPSPGSRLKAQNPQLSDAAIGSILKKRERRAALDEEKYGAPSTPETTKVAPLFGPNSHYARGTVDPRFLPPTPLYGSGKKRKLDGPDDQVTAPRNRGFSLDDDSQDSEPEIDSLGQSTMLEEEEVDSRPAKRQRAQDGLPTAVAPATPRSALKKPGMPGSIGRKSVAFGESISRDIRGHYGPAGQYKGSTFADDLSDDHSLLSVDQADVISPTTRLNTFANSGRKQPSIRDNLGASVPSIDFTLRDPHDLDWRPSLGNPRPGVFRVPDVDEEDPDESMGDFPPEQPQTPRMSHAELPGGSSSTAASVLLNDNSVANDSAGLALDKARSKAEKYKPKSSSRLSEVSRARSRSTSPDAEVDDQSSMDQLIKPSTTTAPAVRPIGAPPQPFIPRELDDSVKGSDGMTDREREHQYDSWAANLDWDAPQTYEDAGTGSAFIHNLIRKNWTAEDSQRSETFWAREFDEVDRAMEAARANGYRLTLVTGMEGIEGY